MFTQRVSLTNQDARTVSTTQLHQLGTICETADGRVYRYARAGGTALLVGNLNINADLVANHTNRTVVAAAIGARNVSVNIGATATTLNQYKDGYMTVNDATGEGITYSVAGNAVNAGSSAVAVTLNEPLIVALTASSSEVTLKLNPFADVVISIADQADQPVGVANTAVAAASYAWLQTGGECAVLADEAVAKGLALTTGTGTVGAVEALDAAGEFQIGVATEALVDTEYRSAFLTMN